MRSKRPCPWKENPHLGHMIRPNLGIEPIHMSPPLPTSKYPDFICSVATKIVLPSSLRPRDHFFIHFSFILIAISLLPPLSYWFNCTTLVRMGVQPPSRQELMRNGTSASLVGRKKSHPPTAFPISNNHQHIKQHIKG